MALDDFQGSFTGNDEGVNVAAGLGICLAFFISTTVLAVVISWDHNVRQQRRRTAELLEVSRKAHNVVVGYGTASLGWRASAWPRADCVSPLVPVISGRMNACFLRPAAVPLVDDGRPCVTHAFLLVLVCSVSRAAEPAARVGGVVPHAVGGARSEVPAGGWWGRHPTLCARVRYGAAPASSVHAPQEACHLRTTAIAQCS